MKKRSSATPSVYPICDGNTNQRVVSIKNLYVTDTISPQDIMTPALFYEKQDATFLEQFKQSRIHCCFIVDEYGSLLG